jgi:hypothetical protein
MAARSWPERSRPVGTTVAGRGQTNQPALDADLGRGRQDGRTDRPGRRSPTTRPCPFRRPGRHRLPACDERGRDPPRGFLPFGRVKDRIARSTSRSIAPALATWIRHRLASRGPLPQRRGFTISRTIDGHPATDAQDVVSCRPDKEDRRGGRLVGLPAPGLTARSLPKCGRPAVRVVGPTGISCRSPINGRSSTRCGRLAIPISR